MEISNERVNKWLFAFIILAILPTCVFGVFGNIEKHRTQIWVWDVLIVGFIFLVSTSLNKKMKRNRLFIAACFIFVMAIQYITYVTSLERKLIEPIYMVLPIVYFIHFAATFIFCSGIKIKECDFTKFFECFFYFVLLSCLYNFLINYKVIFNIANLKDKYIHISSFFPHRNAFGQFVFLGIVSNIYLIIKKPNKKLYIALAFMFLNLVLSFSRTSLFTTIIFCLLFILFNMKNKQQLLKIIILSTFIVMIVLFVILLNGKILDFFDKYVFRISDGLTGRNKIWNVALELLGDGKIFTGYGLGASTALLKRFNLSNSHNSYIEAFITGGLSLFLLYAMCYMFIFKSINMIKNRSIKNLYKSFYIAFLIYCFFEKVLIFSTGYAAVFFTIFFVVIPILISQNCEKEVLK